MSLQEEEVEFGALSRRRDVRDWVMQTPKCQACGFYAMISFSGPAYDSIWPVCSNRKCPYAQRPHTFYWPMRQKGAWRCERSVLALWAMLRKRVRMPRELVAMICHMVWSTRRQDEWNE